MASIHAALTVVTVIQLSVAAQNTNLLTFSLRGQPLTQFLLFTPIALLPVHGLLNLSDRTKDLW